MQGVVFSAPGDVRSLGLLGTGTVPAARFLTAERPLPDVVEALAATEPIIPAPRLEAA